MRRLSSLATGSAIAIGLLIPAVAALPQPRDPCIPPGTYSPALGGPPSKARPAGDIAQPAEGEAAATRPEAEPGIVVPCTPMGAVRVPSGSDLKPPELAVVMTDFRPKDVLLYLDQRFIGRARSFNGKKGFLFLEPGEYRLEARLAGYRTVVFAIDARSECRFDVRYRMQRDRSAAPAELGGTPEVESPERRVYGPVTSPQQAAPPAPAGPDRSLRPDLGGEPPRERPEEARRGASLHLNISPPEASVYLDGEFLATAAELVRMVAPLAIAPGDHVLEVWAPGYGRKRVEFAAQPGEVAEVDVTLQPAAVE